jgi:hypothetical protein
MVHRTAATLLLFSCASASALLEPEAVDGGYWRAVAASSTTPYDPAACWPLSNASGLPAQCGAPTWSLDPPCPRCWANDAPDDPSGGHGPAPTLPPATRAAMAARLEQYLTSMLAARPASHKDVGTVFSGHGGRALLLLKLHAATANATYLQLAAPYVDAMAGKLVEQEAADLASGAVGFQWSHVGMLCVAAVAADRRGDAAAAGAYVGKVVGVFRSGRGQYDGFDSGRAGLLFAARFLDANLPALAAAAEGGHLVPRALVLATAQAIIDRGEATGRANGNAFLQWHGPNDAGLWLGQSHGSAGVLGQLLAVPELLPANASAASLVRATLDPLVSVQFASGNFPAEYYNATQDWLVQWDHGAPGVSAALLAAAAAPPFRGTAAGAAYARSAARALDCAWRRGLVTKGLMSCHGIGGNTWMQLYAAQVTGNTTYAYRALAFQDTVLGTPLLSDPARMRQPQPLPDGPWQFWTGSTESAILLWTDLLHRGPRDASMSGWMPQL